MRRASPGEDRGLPRGNQGRSSSTAREADSAATPPLRLEPENEWAWCGERRIDLAPREFAVLRYLVGRAGKLVTKTELLDAVWAGTVVSEAALTSCIRDLRRALGDSSRGPLYIETVHRRGFRFIGPVAAASAPSGAAAAPRAAEAAVLPPRSPLVGRDADLARLQSSFADAAAGRRRVVLVSGEAGIGKTSLVEAFLATLDSGDAVRVGRGQCVEQFGAGEAYLPVLEALARLGREPGGGSRLVATLRRYAPAWLAHLPGLLDDDELAAVEHRAQATTRERTLRELAEALDALGADAPLVLVFEDLHWSDSATIDLLAMIARRRDPARVLVVGTYRPADVAATGHPLKAALQELRLHGDCVDVALDFLDEGAIRDYLAGRFPQAAFPRRLAHDLARGTSGNPLFLVNVVDDLVARGCLREVDGRWTVTVALDEIASTAPRTLRQMVEKQIDRLTPFEREVLAAASLVGVEFTPVLAASDDAAAHVADEVCDALARQGRFLEPIGAGEWPDGTLLARYRFIHALYQDVLQSRVPIGARVGLHLRIGDRLERAHGPRAGDIAGELAVHFENGRDLERAARYHRLAAEVALRRHAHREVAEHARRALALSAHDDSPEGLRQELALQMLLGAALVTGGWAAPEAEKAYARALEVRRRVPSTPERLAELAGLYGFYVTRAELAVSRELADDMLAIAAASDDTAVALDAHNAAGVVAFYTGEFAAARDHLERVIAIYDPSRHSPAVSPGFWGGQDVGALATVHTAWLLWLLGFPDQAAERMRQGLARARAVEHPYTLAFATHLAASFYQCRGEVELVRDLDAPAAKPAPPADEEASASSDGQRRVGIRIGMLATLDSVRRGWLLCQDGDGDAGIEAMRSGIAAYRAYGFGFGVPTLLGVLAESCNALGRPGEGMAAIAQAREVASRSGAHYWDAELERLEGELTAAVGGGGGQERAGARFAAALDIARRQGARVLELRAAVSLARLLQRRGDAPRARERLAKALGGLTEGFETRDLLEASALLAAPRSRGGKRSRTRSP